MGQGDYGNTTPLDSHLRSKLSGINVTADGASKPVCTRCESVGESADALVIDAGEPIYASAAWTSGSGWDLFGVYHAEHGVSGIADSNPHKPVAVLRGRLQRTGVDTNGADSTAPYRLANLAVVEINYPSTLQE
jgi:hypothetical protein